MPLPLCLCLAPHKTNLNPLTGHLHVCVLPWQEGGSITAALFLSEFVDVKKTAWAHLDMAGPVWNPTKGKRRGAADRYDVIDSLWGIYIYMTTTTTQQVGRLDLVRVPLLNGSFLNHPKHRSTRID